MLIVVYWEGALVLVFFKNLIGGSDAHILIENTAVENSAFYFLFIDIRGQIMHLSLEMLLLELAFFNSTTWYKYLFYNQNLLCVKAVLKKKLQISVLFTRMRDNLWIHLKSAIFCPHRDVHNPQRCGSSANICGKTNEMCALL